MVLDNKNMFSVLRTMVVGKQSSTNNSSETLQMNPTTVTTGSKPAKSLKSVSLDMVEEVVEGKEVEDSKLLLNRSYSTQEKMAHRKRIVSECASIIADPTQVSGQPTGCLKWKSWVPTALRIPCLILCLYTFICSLEILATSFRLMAGKTAGSIFSENPLLSNPVVGLMIGVMFTVLVQSSSTCTSVIVSMVSSGILQVENAIPMIMGANIGTSLTNTLVSFSQLTDREQFERAFAGATVHDCFNWLSVFVLLTLEVCTGYMYHLTGWLTNHLKYSDVSGGGGYDLKSMNVLGMITKPLTTRIVQVDKSVLKCWALGGCQDQRLLKVWCADGSKDKGVIIPALINSTTSAVEEGAVKCGFLFNIESIPDLYLGIILFVVALISLSGCLIFIVKLLHSLLQGTVAELAKKTINSEVPGCPWMTGYIAIFAGALLTFLVQSSSVFTSTITPLVGIGLISVDRMYPLTLGSNIGTTTTALLASLSADPSMLASSLQIALCHLSFNLHGILLFYPIPAMRWPLVMCKVLGRTTARYRWFALLYLFFMFALCPGIVLLLSLAGSIVLTCTIVPVLFCVFIIILINVLQESRPAVLPNLLKSWNFLPEWMHSLDPLDRFISRYGCLGNYSEIPDQATDTNACSKPDAGRCLP